MGQLEEDAPQVRTLTLLWSLAAEPTVHVEIDPAAQQELAASSDEPIELWLGHRLVEEGYAIGEAGDASIVVRVGMRDGALWIEADAGVRHDAIELDISGDPIARLELLHHAVAMLERIAAAPVEPPPTTVAAVAPASLPEPAAASPTDTVPTAPAARVRPPLVGRLHLRGGVIGRRNAVDGAISGGVRVGRARGPGVRIELGLWPSRPRGGVGILELAPSLGFGWSFALGKRVELEPALLAGVLIHGWRFDGIRRAAVDGNFELPLELAVKLGRGVRLVVVPSFGAATRRREHVFAGQPVWSRGAVRGGLAIGIAWQSEPRR